MRHPRVFFIGWGLLVLGWASLAAAAEAELPSVKPVPATQVLPLPYDQASFVFHDRELTRYHFGAGLVRPFWYPITGPGGQSLTRMAHPHDPQSHRHHYSVWISHADVGGVDFWSDNGGRIVHQELLQYDDGDREASMLSRNVWRDKAGGAVLLERRRTAVQPLENGQWRMVIDLALAAPGDKPVVLGQTPFGMIGVRLRKTIGVHDGGGRILNSAGQVNEAQAFRKPARWVDYSGAVTNDARAGIALFDHPQNPGQPTAFHVRDDGWMGASLTLNAPQTIEPGQPLRLRYGLWVHDGVPNVETVDRQFNAFAKIPTADLEGAARR